MLSGRFYCIGGCGAGLSKRLFLTVLMDEV
jgi:hypothetical protein